MTANTSKRDLARRIEARGRRLAAQVLGEQVLDAQLRPAAAIASAEEQARLAETRLREALNVLPEGIVFLDAEGRYVLWNKKYSEIYHRSADLFREGVKLADTLAVGVGRGDYPEAVGREEDWLAARLALLDNPGERHQQFLADGLSRTALDDSQQKLLATIMASANDLNVLLADILDFSRLEAGKIDIQSQPLAIEELALECAALFRGNAAAKGLTLTTAVAP